MLDGVRMVGAEEGRVGLGVEGLEEEGGGVGGMVATILGTS